MCVLWSRGGLFSFIKSAEMGMRRRFPNTILLHLVLATAFGVPATTAFAVPSSRTTRAAHGEQRVNSGADQALH